MKKSDGSTAFTIALKLSRSAKFCLIVILLGMAQVTLLDYFKVLGIKPDLLLICAVSAALFFKFNWAFFYCILAGALKDIFSSGAFGINTILFSLWCFLIARLTKQISIEDNIVRLPLMFILSLMHGVCYGSSLIYLATSIPIGIFLRNVFVSAIYTASVSPLVFNLFTRNYVDQA